MILDATWRDAHQRERVRGLAAETLVPVVELSCSIPVRDAAVRVQNRGPTTSDATPEIAARLAQPDDAWPDAHRIDTGRPLTDSVAEASRIVYESAPVE